MWMSRITKKKKESICHSFLFIDNDQIDADSFYYGCLVHGNLHTSFIDTSQHPGSHAS